METQDWRIGAIPVPPSFPVFLAPSGRLDRRSEERRESQLCQAGVRLEIPNQTPYHIAQLRSISKISQIISMARPEHIPSYHPSKFPSWAPSQTPFSNSIPPIPLPHTHSPTHFKHPPSLFPLAPPQLHLTHGLYQAALGGHTGNIPLAFKAEFHSRVQSQVQSRMQSCIQSCTGVKRRF